MICILVAAVTFLSARALQSRQQALLWLDAMGLALFALTGAKIALEAGVGGFIAIVMGVVTATFGGIIRDLLGGEVPIVLSREIYVSAALLGSAICVGTVALGPPMSIAMVAGFIAAFALRAAALVWGWSLPRYTPGRD